MKKGIFNSDSCDKSMEQISIGRNLFFKDAGKTIIPNLIKPMFATSVEEPFDRKDWIFEIKWDGYRVIADIRSKKIRLYSRNNVSFNDRFYPIVEALESFPGEFVIDGEVVVVDEEGKASFQMLQHYIKTGVGKLIFYVFDILFVNHCDLRDLPLIRRKEILKQILPTDIPNVKYVEHVENSGTHFFHAAMEKSIEGIVAKDKLSTYQCGKRSLSWQKIKIHNRQEAVIAGFTEPRGTRKHVRAVILGVYEKGNLKYIGHTGAGYGEEDLKHIHEKLEKIKTGICPFKDKPKTNTTAHWVKPLFVAEVSFSGWTKDGVLRQPILLGLRDDKNPLEITREKSKKINKKIYAVEKEKQKEIGQHKVKLTNTDKVFWPNQGYTKGDLINYYEKISPYILPYLQDRPESLNRFPNGINKESFYQKDVDHTAPEWVQKVSLYSESGNKSIRYALCQNKETILYLSNLGCIEMNPWNSLHTKPDFPDYMVLDIDPPKDVPFKEAVKVALTTHDILNQAKIKNLCKTSGATGLHVFIPLAAKYHYERVRDFAFLINTLVHHKLPNITSLERKAEKRQKKIYLDYLQNRRGQTMASVYSVRPHDGAPVSTPLSWDEVTSNLNPQQFNIENTLKRLQKKGDLWIETIGKGVDMEEALKRLDRLMRAGS